MGMISGLSNARYAGLRETGKARSIIGDANHAITISGFKREIFEILERSFDEFAELFTDACSGIHVRRRLFEAHQIYETRVLPVLEDAGVSIIDAGNYCNSSLKVYLVDAPEPAGKLQLKVPLRSGWRKFFNDSIYDAHARFEEVLHLLQFLNAAPLTTTGLKIEKSLIEGDSSLLSCLTKSWQSAEARRMFVRENDILAVYMELLIEPTGIFLFPYDRRGVLHFIRSL